MAVFAPLLADSEEILEREAVCHYRAIKYSELTAACKTSLLEAFVSWLEQRLKHKSKREIEMVLLGELPELEETQSGKDLIRIGEERGELRGELRGEQRGELRGLQKAILVSLKARYGMVPATMPGQDPLANHRRSGTCFLNTCRSVQHSTRRTSWLANLEA